MLLNEFLLSIHIKKSLNSESIAFFLNMPSPVKLQFQSLIQSACVETTAKVEVLSNKILHCTISQILTLFTKSKMAINWIKGKWDDNTLLHCKKIFTGHVKTSRNIEFLGRDMT